ncbi:MAG: hypothetical protein KBC35_02170 [Candidatus Pacebacteria bacterium]|nr:hypothetical protein [Candidatus Paceibacterota bacterium]
MEKFIVLEKQIGETPLSCAEAYRATRPDLAGVPMAYAGRLDPMASGKLLVLLGEECKVQEKYHGLDKEYEFSVLFGIESDTHDVLGRLQTCHTVGVTEKEVRSVTSNLIGQIELPYPHFSAKTVKNKPLHMWTLGGRLDEIKIPTNRTTIYELELTRIETKPREQVAMEARAKIDTIPPVIDERKALGNDFRRVDVRKDWAEISSGNFGPVPLSDSYTIAHFRCIASSGTYMRSLAHLIGQKLGTCGLAWHIHRTKIGTYDPTSQAWNHQY